MEIRENFTRLVSPPHLEDPLLVEIFDTSSAVDTFIIVSDLISPAFTHWVAGAQRKGLSSMAQRPLPSGASPTASGTTGAVSPSKVFFSHSSPAL